MVRKALQVARWEYVEKIKSKAFLISLFLMPVVCESRTPEAEKVLTYLRGLGNGRYMFGQMATWVHNENPDMDRRTRPGIAWMWLKNWKLIIPNWRDLSSGVTMGIIM